MRSLFLILLLCGAVAAMFLVRGGAQTMTLSNAKAIPAHGMPGAFVIGVTMTNRDGPDQLIGASTTDSATIEILHPNEPQSLVIPGMSSAALAADGAHIRISGLSPEVIPGSFIPVTLTFENAGDVSTRAQVGSMGDMDHSGAVEIFGESGPLMSVALSLTGPASAQGVSAYVETTGFEFKTVADDAAHVFGEGHGHLFLNGLKLGRIYQPRVAVGALPLGQFRLRVVLNSNDHRAYELNGRAVSDALFFRIGAQ